MEILFRMLFALGIVLLIMWAMARFARKQYGTKPDAVLSVLARQPLSRTSSVAVVKVMDKAIVVGVTEQGINLLGDTDLELVEASLAVPERPAGASRIRFSSLSSLKGLDDVEMGPDGVSLPARKGALDGSALSPKTWKQLVNAAREATVRK